MNRSTPYVLLSLSLGIAAQGKPAHTPSQAESISDSFVFQLLPNSLSKNPRLEMSFITEMTDTGRKLTPASPTAPTYYLAQSGGYRQLGHDSYAGEQIPPPAGVEKLMEEALGRAGYLPADSLHPATLVVIYHWGSYPRASSVDGYENLSSAAARNHHLLERAVLVGGEKFSRELEAAIVEASSLAPSSPAQAEQAFGNSGGYSATTLANYGFTNDNYGAIGPIDSNYMGLRSMAMAQSGFSNASYMAQAFNPINVFLSQSAKNRALFELASGSCYYVIASAYDAEAVAQKKKILLWRTKMCVAADGVSLADTVKPMIARSPRYLGKETDGAVNVSRRMYEGKVELGETKIMGEVENPTKPKK